MACWDTDHVKLILGENVTDNDLYDNACPGFTAESVATPRVTLELIQQSIETAVRSDYKCITIEVPHKLDINMKQLYPTLLKRGFEVYVRETLNSVISTIHWE